MYAQNQCLSFCSFRLPMINTDPYSHLNKGCWQTWHSPQFFSIGPEQVLEDKIKIAWLTCRGSWLQGGIRTSLSVGSSVKLIIEITLSFLSSWGLIYNSFAYCNAVLYLPFPSDLKKYATSAAWVVFDSNCPEWEQVSVDLSFKF